MSRLNGRVNRLEDAAGDDGKPHIFVCWCSLEGPHDCTCPASQAADDDTVIKVIEDRPDEPTKRAA